MPLSISRRPHCGKSTRTLPAELERIILKGLARTGSRATSPLRTSWRTSNVCNAIFRYEVRARSPNRPHRGYALAGLVVAAVVAAFVLSRSGIAAEHAERPPYVQLTNFTDSATNPAVSPDGRMLAFIRGSSTFLDPGQVYVKPLPDGELVRITHDDRRKMAPVFSPDGSRIAYTVHARTSGPRGSCRARR